MGRVAADGEAGADYASHTEGGGRGYELVTVGPDKSNRGLLGCQATFSWGEKIPPKPEIAI